MEGRKGRTSSPFLQLERVTSVDPVASYLQTITAAQMLPLKTLASSPLLGKRLISAWANVKQGPPDAILGELRALDRSSFHPTRPLTIFPPFLPLLPSRSLLQV